MRKHSANSSIEYVSSVQDSLSKMEYVQFSFKEKSLKDIITTDNADGNEVDNSSEMTIASFRDSACALKPVG